MSKQQIAKSLMDLALKSDAAAVEFTAAPNAVLSLRTECYKLRSALRSVNANAYDKLSFSTRSESTGMMTMIVEKH